jgi:phosphotransferase family enzyme
LVAYPHLSSEQQHGLPELIQVAALPAIYEDSTHQLWQCDTSQGQLILKICSSNQVDKSTFWQGMANLFDVDLARQLGKFDQVYKDLTTLSHLAIPEYISSGSNSQQTQAFILATKLSGTMVTNVEVDDDMVINLANHIGNLHQHGQLRWGRFFQADFGAELWPTRLQITLKSLAEKQKIVTTEMLDEAVEFAANCTVDRFVPIMPDLRWDQFLQQNGNLSALVDLDAFVYGPRELELVLLEYLLDEQQANIFSEHYQKSHFIPDLTQVRKPYRLLLFMMNVLGEKDVDAWMEASTRF